MLDLENGTEHEHKGQRKSPLKRKAFVLAEEAVQENVRLEERLRECEREIELLKRASEAAQKESEGLLKDRWELECIIRHVLQEMQEGRRAPSHVLHSRLQRHAPKSLDDNFLVVESTRTPSLASSDCSATNDVSEPARPNNGTSVETALLCVPSKRQRPGKTKVRSSIEDVGPTMPHRPSQQQCAFEQGTGISQYGQHSSTPPLSHDAQNPLQPQSYISDGPEPENCLTYDIERRPNDDQNVQIYGDSADQAIGYQQEVAQHTFANDFDMSSTIGGWESLFGEGCLDRYCNSQVLDSWEGGSSPKAQGTVPQMGNNVVV